MTHTPGPWAFMDSNNWSDLRWNQPSSVCHVGDFTVVTTEKSYEFHGTDKDDARLIAAAPDLLAALKDVVAIADRKTDEFDRARAAITKATGGGDE